MIAGYAAFVPCHCLLPQQMDARLASAGDRDGMAIACRRPPAHGIPHTARRNDDEGRSLRRKRYSCRCDRILGYRSVPFVQGICSRVTAAAVLRVSFYAIAMRFRARGQDTRC